MQVLQKLLFLIVILSVQMIEAQRTIEFSGITWQVKNSRETTKGPGKNYWSDSNESVWVDNEGSLHLKIRKEEGKWYAAEIISQNSFGYGDYTFFISSNVETYDPNIVVGLFTYEDDKNEIDIEFSQWGDKTDVYAGYTIQPAPYTPMNHNRFALNLNGNYSTHKFVWNPNSVFFQSYHGHFQNLPHKDYLIHSWEYKGKNVPKTGKEHLHINFWLYTPTQAYQMANSPTNGQEVELIIKAVSTPFAFR